jgi:hypothetical protein
MNKNKFIKYRRKYNSYRLEFLIRNNEYITDWNNFFSNPSIEKGVEILLKWGWAAFPECDRIGDRKTGLSRCFDTKDENDINLMKSIFFEYSLKKYMSGPRYDFSHSLMERNLEDFRKQIESPRPAWVNPILYIPGKTRDKDKHLKPTQDNIPEEITITLQKFPKYFYAISEEKKLFRERLLEDLDEQLKRWEKLAIESGVQKQTRLQVNLYDKYLEVWDLVQEKGENWTEIAKIVYPEDFRDKSEQLENEYTSNPESARVKVEQHYKAVCRLIDNVAKLPE